MKLNTRLFVTAWFCLAVLAAHVPAFAQGGGATTSLSGTVTDTSGAIIPGANVVVKSNATATQFDAVTNESGYFSVPALDPGTYTVTVTLMGFKTAVLNDVRVNASTPATVKVALAVGGLEETVVVTGGAEIIQTTSAAVTSTIDANQILKIPTGSRSALEFVALLPGVQTPGGPGGSRDSMVNGLPQSAINITIDGMSAQDNHLKTGDGFFARVSPRLDAIEEVTVNSAAQDSASTGQGAVQIRFVTRSGSNQFTGSGYYYLQHYKLNSNTWFNNRDNAPKADDVLHQPGARFGGPIIIPGLWNGRNKAFFFVNYEESRSPGGNTENRTLLHPRAEQGWFRYTASGQTREVNVLGLGASNSTIDPTIARLLGDIRSSTAGSTVVDNTDPLTQTLTYSYNTDSVTKYPTGRVDVNVTDKHRLSWSMTYTDLVSTPDTTNNREPNFPGFPNTGSQVSDRYIMRGTLRSTLGANLVNEFTVGGSGGATMFAPEIAASQFSGTSVADQSGFLLNINAAGGITNAASTGSYSAREASTKVIENTLSWLRGSHSIQAGGAWTRTDVWLQNQQYVPTMNFGPIDGADPAFGLFSTTTFPGASNAQLTEARDLFAVLTGRVASINGEQRLDENTDEYVFLGLGLQRARLVDYGFFVADTWRWKPNFTLNLGLRYDLQLPFYPRNNSYSKATVADVWGRSGIGNLFSPGGLTGQPPTFSQYDEGEGGYDTDLNNWAPNFGVAWTLGGNPGFLGTLLGKDSGDSVLRAGYSMGYNRPGTSDFTGAIANNPGVSLTANRNHALANLGTPGSIFLRNSADLGPPANMPTTRVYPMSDVFTGDVTVFEPGLQVPYGMTWTGGWQRKVGSSMVVEARYVGTRSLQSWQTYNYNEINIVENGFLNEFRLAQQNLEANRAANLGNTFKYTGAAGTSPLPIFLAHFQGLPASAAGNPASYSATNTNWTNNTFLGYLAKFNPTPYNFANTGNDRLIGNGTFRSNALTAGLPANFFQANPDLIGGANIVGNGGATRYNSLQLELRKRLAQGLQFQTSYVYGKTYGTSRYSLRFPRQRTQDTGEEGGVNHAFRANWVYELPFGQGRRFASGAGTWMNHLVGGWSFDGIARLQSGTTFDFGNVRLMGMSAKELQDSFKLRFDDAGKLVYMLPQDIIDNTVRAFSTSGTSATGYSDQGVPTGRFLAPANGPDCIEVGQTNALTGNGDCGVRSLVVTGPMLVRFDLSTSKRIAIKGNTNVEFRAEFLNAFNTPWFEAVTGSANNTYSNPDEFRVTDADSGRTIQFVFRVNW